MTLLYIACGIYAGLFPMIILKLLRIKEKLEEQENYNKCLRRELSNLETAKIHTWQTIKEMSATIRVLENKIDFLQRQTAGRFIHDLHTESEVTKNAELD